MRLIDADKVIQSVDRQMHMTRELLKNYTQYQEIVSITGQLFKQTIINTSTVDAELVRYGHWIFNPKDAIEMMFTLPKCSVCGTESPNGGNYCPNCGAKMDEEKENERTRDKV